MNQQSPVLAGYYRDAATWNHDRTRATESSQRLAWYVAATAAMIAIFEAVALVVLMPLKTVEPYTLLVDRTTGYVQGIKSTDPAMIAPDSALTQSFLVQYVTAREGFDISTIVPNYRKVALLSADKARASYLARMKASNPENPVNSYPMGTVVETRLKSVSPMGEDTAFVRFDTLVTHPNGQQQSAMPWVAVIRFRYSGQPMRLEDRFVNPLGFQVVHYRRDAEAVPATASQPNSAGPARPYSSNLTANGHSTPTKPVAAKQGRGS